MENKKNNKKQQSKQMQLAQQRTLIPSQKIERRTLATQTYNWKQDHSQIVIKIYVKLPACPYHGVIMQIKNGNLTKAMHQII